MLEARERSEQHVGTAVATEESLHPAQIVEKCIAEAFNALSACKQGRGIGAERVCGTFASSVKVVVTPQLTRSGMCVAVIYVRDGDDKHLLGVIGEKLSTLTLGGIMELYRHYTLRILGLALEFEGSYDWEIDVTRNRDILARYLRDYDRVVALLSEAAKGRIVCIELGGDRLAVTRLPNGMYVLVHVYPSYQYDVVTFMVAEHSVIRIGRQAGKGGSAIMVYSLGEKGAILKYTTYAEWNKQASRSIIGELNHIRMLLEGNPQLTGKIDVGMLVKKLAIMALQALSGRRCVQL